MTSKQRDEALESLHHVLVLLEHVANEVGVDMDTLRGKFTNEGLITHPLWDIAGAFDHATDACDVLSKMEVTE